MSPGETLDLTAPRHREEGHRYRRRQLWSLRPGKQPAPLELVHLKCRLLDKTGQIERCAALLSTYAPKAEAMGDRRWAAAFASDLAHALKVLGEAGAAMPHAERAVSLFRELGDEAGLGSAQYCLAGIFSDLGQEERATQLNRDLLELAERTGQTDLSVKLLHGLRDELGLEKAVERIKGHLESARLAGDKPLIAMACFYLGDIYLNTGRWAEAEACNQEQYRIAAETGNRMGMSFAIGDRGLICNGRGHYREAIACYLEKLEISEAMGDSYNVYEALDNLGVSHLHLGEFAKALEYFGRAEAHTRRHQVQHFLSKSLMLKAQTLFELGQWRRSAEAVGEALDIARDIGEKYVEFYGALLEARLAARQGADAAPLFEALLAQAGDEEQKADVNYEFHKLTGDPERRRKALDHYRRFYDQSKLHYVTRRIEELEA